MYSNPRSLFQEKISSILDKNKTCSALFENIFKLQYLYKLEKITSEDKELTEDWCVLLRIYEEIGPENFAKIVSIIRGRSLSFPTEEELQDSIVTTLCYYYKEVENKTWEEIKALLNMPDLNTISYGIKTRQFAQFIKMQTLRALHKVENEQQNINGSTKSA